MIRDIADRLGVDFDDFVGQRAKDIPFGRSGWPKDTVAASLYSASEEASLVSGQVPYVAGGPRT